MKAPATLDEGFSSPFPRNPPHLREKEEKHDKREKQIRHPDARGDP